jgi:hypothetical protein
VPKAHTDVLRMIVNNRYPQTPMYTTVGERELVVSLNSSTRTRSDRQLRRLEQEAAAATWEALPDDAAAAAGASAVEAAPRRRRRLAAPALVSVQALARRAEYSPPAALPGSGEGATVLPQEFKAFFFELMVTISVLAHVGEMLGLVVVILSDDFKSFFHQFALSFQQRWTCHLMTLDPAAITPEVMEALLAAASEPELALVSEFCMSMGTTPSSNWAQRYTTEFMLDFEARFHAAHVGLYDEWAALSPRFAQWRSVRAALGEETGRCEQYLLKGYCFTDDPICALLCSCTGFPGVAPVVPDGCVLVVDAVVAWGTACRKAGLIRGDPSKRCLGVSGTWIGVRIYTPGLLAYLGKAKMMRAAEGLEAYLLGSMQVTAFQELAGLMHHIVFTVALPKYVMYNFYDGLDQLHREAGGATPLRRLLFLCGGSGDGGALGVAPGVEVHAYGKWARRGAASSARRFSSACSAASRRWSGTA